MKMKTPLAVAAFASVLFISCKKEATNGDTASFTYHLQTINRTSAINRTAPVSRTQGANIEWTSGTASATELKFEAENNAGEVEFKQKAEQQIDLFAFTSVLGNIAIPPGTYSEVEFKASLSPSNAAPALALAGSFVSNNVTTPIQFVVNSSVELKAEKNNVTVAQGATYSVLNTIDLSTLTTGLAEAALNNATLTNGVLVLSVSSNTELYNTVLNNLYNHHGEAEIEHD